MTEPAIATNAGQPTDDAPAPVRAALLALSAEVLGSLEPAEVPVALRQVQRFAPRRRASAGALPLWAALGRDDGFRGRVARVWSHAWPELAARLTDPPGASTDPTAEADVHGAEAAVGAWLLRPAGWRDVVAAVGDDEGGTGAVDASGAAADLAARAARAEAQVARLGAQLGLALAAAADAQDAVAALTREQRRLRSDADRARSESRRHLAEAARERADAERLRAEAQVALDRADRSLRAGEAERTAARGEVRVARELATTRVRLLLDTLVDAGTSLRHELALPPVATRPADLVAPAVAPALPVRQGSRGRAAHEPAMLDELLALPYAHLVVDGYNVTKTGYPHLTLAEQRTRLVDALATALGHTGAEITCCFDGQEGPRPAGGYARGIRVLFSVGEIADDLIRRLVLAEPPGRVVVVVTSDQEVVTDVQEAGAWAVPSATLLARLAHA